MQRLHAYPDIRAMFRRLLIATLTGILAALAVAVFRHSMYLLEWLFLSNNSGSLVNAAAALSPWRRALTPALGGLAAGLLLWGWQRFWRAGRGFHTDVVCRHGHRNAVCTTLWAVVSGV
ncbi:H+/Cl- antiporter ClcA|nr:H+/Cl- antiporter ClcA [Enterobacter ludwigii]